MSNIKQYERLNDFYISHKGQSPPGSSTELKVAEGGDISQEKKLSFPCFLQKMFSYVKERLPVLSRLGLC